MHTRNPIGFLVMSCCMYLARVVASSKICASVNLQSASQYVGATRDAKCAFLEWDFSKEMLRRDGGC